MQQIGYAEHGGEHDHGYGGDEALLEPETDRVSHADNDQDRDEHPHGVGDQPSG